MSKKNKTLVLVLLLAVVLLAAVQIGRAHV